MEGPPAPHLKPLILTHLHAFCLIPLHPLPRPRFYPRLPPNNGKKSLLLLISFISSLLPCLTKTGALAETGIYGQFGLEGRDLPLWHFLGMEERQKAACLCQWLQMALMAFSSFLLLLPAMPHLFLCLSLYPFLKTEQLLLTCLACTCAAVHEKKRKEKENGRKEGSGHACC